jgi:upstream activation factor subunit UAF30
MNYGDEDERLHAHARRLKINPEAIAADVKAKLTPAPKATGKPTWKEKDVFVPAKPSFQIPAIPSEQLAAITGDKPIKRVEVTKKVWAYIKKHGLQDQKNKRFINADEKLLPVFAKKQLSMFEMTKAIAKHLAQRKGTKAAKAKGKKK